MNFTVEIVPACFSPEAGPFVVDVSATGSRTIAVLDGTGSWGAGAAAARAVATCVEAEWRAHAPMNPAHIEDCLASCLSEIPQELRADDWGHGFSFTNVLLTETEAWVVACGWYGVLHLSGSSSQTIFRPLAWVEQQVENGNLTPEEAATHQFRNVFAGEMVSADKALQLEVIQVPTRGRLVITSMELFRTLKNIASARSLADLSAADLHTMEQDAHARHRPLILVAFRTGFLESATTRR